MATTTRTKGQKTRQRVPFGNTSVRRHQTLCGEVNDVISALGRFADAADEYALNPTPENMERIHELCREVLAETIDCTQQATGLNTMTLGTGTKELKN